MQNSENTVDYAGFAVRLCAWLVDMFVVGVLLCFIRVPVFFIGISHPNNFLVRDLVFEYSLLDIVCWLLTVTYFVLLTYNTGSTFGKKVFRIEVISAEGEGLNLWEIIYRESIGRYISAVILWAGYLFMIVDNEKRGFHDMLADTRVVYANGKRKSMAQRRREEYYSVPRDAFGNEIKIPPTSGMQPVNQGMQPMNQGEQPQWTMAQPMDQGVEPVGADTVQSNSMPYSTVPKDVPLSQDGEYHTTGDNNLTNSTKQPEEIYRGAFAGEYVNQRVETGINEISQKQEIHQKQDIFEDMNEMPLGEYGNQNVIMDADKPVGATESSQSQGTAPDIETAHSTETLQ